MAERMTMTVYDKGVPVSHTVWNGRNAYGLEIVHTTLVPENVAPLGSGRQQNVNLPKRPQRQAS